MSRAAKSQALRDAERAVERRTRDVLDAATTYCDAHDEGGRDTRPLLGDIREAVRDLRSAERALAHEQKNAKPAAPAEARDEQLAINGTSTPS